MSKTLVVGISLQVIQLMIGVVFGLYWALSNLNITRELYNIIGLGVLFLGYNVLSITMIIAGLRSGNKQN